MLIIFMLFTDIESSHDVVDCESPALSNHCYWPIVSDFINVLSHKTVAEMFMLNPDLIKQWMKFIGHLTGGLAHMHVKDPQNVVQQISFTLHIFIVANVMEITHMPAPAE